MKRSLILFAGALCATATAQKKQEITPRPNIILFMVDDMGWQDTSVPFWKEKTRYNEIYHTPSMERLAEQGVKFTRAYASSVSSPTRTSLMTGMSPSAHRVTNWTLQKNQRTDDHGYGKLFIPEWNINGLQPQDGIPHTVVATTFPQILQKNGYTTIHCGKAHWGAIDTPGADPLTLGFDINIAGHAAGGLASYLGKDNFGHDHNGIPRSPFAIPGLNEYWGQDITVTEALTIEAKKAMDKALEKGNPFYLYMSHYAIHIPLDKDNKYYQKYIDAGLDDGTARYAALIEGMDNSLGELMDYLEEKNIAENTIIIFMSDNGGLSLNSGRGGRDNSHNYPLSAGKGSAYEGGVRVPMIIKSPYTTELRVCDTPVSIIDFMPTILEMAGIKRYKTRQNVEGVSLVPLLKSKCANTRGLDRPLYWHFPNKWGGTKTNTAGMGYGATSSILYGNWKLIYYYENDRTELFNLDEDIFEIVNQAGNSSVADIRKKLGKMLTKHLRKTRAQLPKKPNGEWCTYPNGYIYIDK